MRQPQLKKDKLLGAFRRCQAGTCECPTAEYANLVSMRVKKEQSGTICLVLTPKEGTAFNLDEIRKCLDSVIER